jgi:hypothetical protein
MKDNNLEPYSDKDSYRNYDQEEAYLRAKKKLNKIVGFYWHLASYLVVNVILIYIIYINTDYGFWSFGTFSTAVFWGIGLFFHFVGVFGPNFMFGRDWENRQIKKFMDDEKKRWE